MSLPTTDPQDELFDVLDAEGNPTGIAKRRGDVHRDGEWHGALHIWVVTSAGEVLFQRRSATKDTWPNHLDVTIGGHFRAGETVKETIREAQEEIGLALSVADLVPLGRRFTSGRHSDVIDREIQQTFAVVSDQPLDAYTLHHEEVTALVAVDIEAAAALLSGTLATIAATECRRDGHPEPATLSAADFIPLSATTISHLFPALQQVAAGNIPETWELHDYH